MAKRRAAPVARRRNGRYARDSGRRKRLSGANTKPEFILLLLAITGRHRDWYDSDVDIKSDLSGLAEPGQSIPRFEKHAKEIGFKNEFGG